MIEMILEGLNLRRFDFTITPPPEVKLLTINNNLILSESNFCLLTGAPKVGKSTFTSIILASAMARKPIFDIQLHRHPDKTRIALFDTEQANYDLHKSIQRTLSMANFTKHFPDSLDVFSLRKDNCETITKLIEYYIETTPDVGTILIDGLLDLVLNFNDEKECKIMIDWMKRITADYNIGIIGVLHTGKTTGQSVGHIGSFADRYCQSNLEIIKDNNNNSINMKGKLLRSSPDFPIISLMRDFDGKLYQIDYVENKENENKRKK